MAAYRPDKDGEAARIWTVNTLFGSEGDGLNALRANAGLPPKQSRASSSKGASNDPLSSLLDESPSPYWKPKPFVSQPEPSGAAATQSEPPEWLGAYESQLSDWQAIEAPRADLQQRAAEYKAHLKAQGPDGYQALANLESREQLGSANRFMNQGQRASSANWQRAAARQQAMVAKSAKETLDIIDSYLKATRG